MERKTSRHSLKLFVIYIGGAHDGSLIELHDMRFVAAMRIEDTYEALRKSWWGLPKSLHLDAWGSLEYADGYEIQLKSQPSSDRQHKLYFVNLGGYDPLEFTELHKNIFVVAENESQAKAKALKATQGWKALHRDNQYAVEKMLDVESCLTKKNVYIHLVPREESVPFKFTCKYVPIGES